MVGVLTATICGVIAGAVVACVVEEVTRRNIRPGKRAAKMQANAFKNPTSKSYSGKKLNKKLIKNYKRQNMALFFRRKPLLERVNYFKYNVNQDGFDQLWDASINDKTWRIVGRAKSKKKIAELKGSQKEIKKAQKRVNKVIGENGIGPMKKMGWTEATKLGGMAGGGYVNRVAGYGVRGLDGVYESGVDNEVLYQLIANCEPEKTSYDAGTIFKATQDAFRGKAEDGSFSRFGVDYPLSSTLPPDRFVIGNVSSDIVERSKMFSINKLVMLANACHKLSNNPDVEEIRIIDESRFLNKNKVQVIKREDFADYINDYVKKSNVMREFAKLEKPNKKGKRKIKDGTIQAIKDTINSFAPEISFETKKSSKRETERV